jgi:hypothetical protein
MAHFAQLDANNIVTEVIVVNNAVIDDLSFPESEPIGVEFCQSLYGADTRWAQTSYNANFRKRYATIGYTFDSALNAFIPPKPRRCWSWVVDPVLCEWVPPVPRPTDDVYKWNEDLIAWLRVPAPYPSWVMQGDPLGWYPPVPRPNDGKYYDWDETTLSWVSVSGA